MDQRLQDITEALDNLANVVLQGYSDDQSLSLTIGVGAPSISRLVIDKSQ